MNITNVTVSDTLLVSTESLLDDEPTGRRGPVFDPDPVTQDTVDMAVIILTCHAVPLIGAFGIVGNVLTFIVLLLEKRGGGMNSVLVVLAVVDAFYLIFVNLDVVSCNLRHSDAIAARNFKIMTLPHLIWVQVTLSRISTMLTVVIAVERCLVVMMPLKIKLWVTPGVIKVTTAVACIIPAVSHIPVFMRGEIQWLMSARLNRTLPYLKQTEFALDNAQFLDLYKNLVLNVLFRYVPMAAVTICTGLTIAQLRRYSKWRMSSITSQSKSSNLSERDTRISVTLMRVCVVFMVCSIPGCINLTFRLIQPEFDYYGTYTRSFALAREFNNFFLVINSSVNFIIYMRGGDEFLNTFCKICQKVLPVCCFQCLFRCVMRSEDYPVTKENQSYNTKKKMAGTTITSTTNVSSVFSITNVNSTFSSSDGQGGDVAEPGQEMNEEDVGGRGSLQVDGEQKI